MIKPKFTKGDWIASQPNGIGWGFKVETTDSEMPGAWFGIKVKSNETKANAYLTASAPDLYKELEAYEKIIQKLDDAKINQHKFLSEILKIYYRRKALAKARGEGK